MRSMVDQTFPADRPADAICPWCSTRVTPETATCPTCGAILLSAEDRDLPGVTAVDPTAMAGAFRLAVEAGRRGFLAGLPAPSSVAEASSPLTGFLN